MKHIMVMSFPRFVLNQRESCPLTWQPFQETCVPRDVVQVYEGLVLERTVSGLQPYSAYDFQVISYNSAGGSKGVSWTRAETLQTSEYPSGVFRCEGWYPANQWVSKWCIQVLELRPFKPLSILVVYTGVRAETQQTIEYPSGVFRCQSWEPANQWVSQWCIWVSELRTNKPLSIPLVYSSVRAENQLRNKYPSGVFKC